MYDKVSLLIVAGALAIVGAFLFLVFHVASEYSNACTDKGGKAIALYLSQLCVSPDGRIIPDD